MAECLSFRDDEVLLDLQVEVLELGLEDLAAHVFDVPDI